MIAGTFAHPSPARSDNRFTRTSEAVITTVESAAWNALTRAHALVTRQLSADLDAHCAITLTTYNILDAVQRRNATDTPARLNDLLAQVATSQPTLSRQIEKLETDGLLKRQPDPQDRRAALLTLTAAGRQAHALATPIYQACIRKYLPLHLARAI